MSGPKRVKVPGPFKFEDLPPGTVYIGRGVWGYPGSAFANPHPIGKPCRLCGGVEHSRPASIIAYRRHLREHPELVERARRELSNMDVACWCSVSEACHGDALIAIVAGEEP
ncbi:MAG TPA: DUF4326 domain-containing protein [Micromonosporaceae bacterium]|nr:DUF4326 domain-containing protein [Micromonosporaceae bacterium]